MVETSNTPVASTTELLKGKVLYQKEFSKHQVIVYDSNILEFIMKPDAILTFKDLDQTRSWLSHFGKKQYLNLIKAGSRTEVEEDFRLTAANSHDYTIADAIVVNGISQRIMANLYLRFNKPLKPTKIFSDEESAAFWLMSFS